uniref:Uncharacterized protein n=1 Tax=Sphaerodactylus townsendi TaxID=933632 RepID=A0ACB8EV06_9SAUR
MLPALVFLNCTLWGRLNRFSWLPLCSHGCCYPNPSDGVFFEVWFTHVRERGTKQQNGLFQPAQKDDLLFLKKKNYCKQNINTAKKEGNTCFPTVLLFCSHCFFF